MYIRCNFWLKIKKRPAFNSYTKLQTLRYWGVTEKCSKLCCVYFFSSEWEKREIGKQVRKETSITSIWVVRIICHFWYPFLHNRSKSQKLCDGNGTLENLLTIIETRTRVQFCSLFFMSCYYVFSLICALLSSKLRSDE